MWSSARSPGPTHVAAAMFTPASLIAAATRASAPGVFSTSMTRSTAMGPLRCQPTSRDGSPLGVTISGLASPIPRRATNDPGGSMRLKGKTALVTGSTSGIGRAIAQAFAAEGAKVVVSGRDETRGREVVDAIRAAGGTAELVPGDVSTVAGARAPAGRAGAPGRGDCVPVHAAR